MAYVLKCATTIESVKAAEQAGEEARELMSDRTLAESLYKTDPNWSWEMMVQKQIDKGLTGDDIYKEIIASAQRSRKAVNKSLGLEWNMRVTYKKIINENKNNRIEFGINNFDYEDGIDYLAKIFCEKYDMIAEEKIDYIYFSVIKLHEGDINYELLWHEDIGNIVYAIEQDENTQKTLEKRLMVVLDDLNKRLEAI